jgi:hypothetical protein
MLNHSQSPQLNLEGMLLYLLFTDRHHIETTGMDIWIWEGVTKKSDQYRADPHIGDTVDLEILLDHRKKTETHRKVEIVLLVEGVLDEKTHADGENNE